jgi:hypothetical protein
MCRKLLNMNETSSSIGGATGNLSTSLFNVARLTAHPKFVWVFNANYDGTIIYNDPVYVNSSRYIIIIIIEHVDQQDIKII